MNKSIRNRVGISFKRHASTLFLVATLTSAAGIGAEGAEPLDEWKPVKSGTDGNFRAITYGNGLFVAVGENGLIATSSAGDNWTLRKSDTTSWLENVTYARGEYVIAGRVSPDGMGTIIASKEGTTWMKRQVNISNDIYAITYNHGIFVATGGGNSTLPLIYTSEDGEVWKSTWQRTNDAVDPLWLSSVTYGNGIFVAVFPGSDWCRAYSLTSKDGYAWTMNQMPKGVEKVTFGNGLFAGTGHLLEIINWKTISHAIVYTSPDGINWTNQVDVQGTIGNAFYDIAYGGGQFVAIGSYGFSSSDGTHWIRRDFNFTGALRKGICFGNGRFVAVGDSGLISNSSSIGKLSSSISPSGQFIGILSGMSGQKYTIETSSGLSDWAPFTNLAITNGTGRFIDYSTNGIRRYFKALPIN